MATAATAEEGLRKVADGQVEPDPKPRVGDRILDLGLGCWPGQVRASLVQQTQLRIDQAQPQPRGSVSDRFPQLLRVGEGLFGGLERNLQLPGHVSPHHFHKACGERPPALHLGCFQARDQLQELLRLHAVQVHEADVVERVAGDVVEPPLPRLARALLE